MESLPTLTFLDINKLHYKRVLTGRRFNEIFKNYSFVKLTNVTEKHNNFQFQDGLNIDTAKFNPIGECNSGGIYFIMSTHAYEWTHYNNNVMIYIRHVTIPDDAQVYVEQYKFKADKLILSQREKINEQLYLESLKNYRIGLKNIPLNMITKEICLASIGIESINFLNIPKLMIDKEMCMLAVKKNGIMLQYIPVHLIDKNMCILAVSDNGRALLYVPESILDKELCMIAADDVRLITLDEISVAKNDNKLCFTILERVGFNMTIMNTEVLDRITKS